MIGAQVDFGAVAAESPGIGAYAVLERRSQEAARTDIRRIQVFRHHGAGSAAGRPYILVGGRRGRFRQRVMVDDDGKVYPREVRVMMRLGVHYGEFLHLLPHGRTPLHQRDAQIAEHGEIVRPGDVVHAGQSHVLHPGADDARKSHGTADGVRVCIDEDAPVLVPVQQGIDLFELGRHHTEIGHPAIS